MDSHTFDLRTLGGVDLLASDGEKMDAVLRQPKRTALLVYLAAARHGSLVQRDSVLALFWPDLDDKHARHALNNSVYFLRSHLGKNALLTRGPGEVGVDPDRLRCDATAFRDGVSGAGRREALRLYQGDFLAGFHPDVSREVDDWIEDERRELRSLARDAALGEARSASKAGDHREAMFWASRAEAVDPSSEEVLRTVLTLLDRAGERSLALEKYHAFETMLEREYDARPSPETERAFELLKSREAGWKSYRDERPSPAALNEMVRPLSGDIEPRSAEDLAELVETLPEAVYRVDIHGVVRYANQETQRLLGYPLEELQGRRYMEIVRQDFRDQVMEFFLRQIEERRAFSYIEYPMIARDGTELWIAQTTRLLERDGEILGSQGVVRYIGTRKRRELSQRDLAQTDFETRLLSRDAFQLLAQHEAARAARCRQPFALLFLALRTPATDGETPPRLDAGAPLGQDALAQALQRLIQPLRADVRAADAISRYRSSEIALLLSDTGREGAETAWTRLEPHLASAAEPWTVHPEIRVWNPEDPTSLDALLNRPDDPLGN